MSGVSNEAVVVGLAGAVVADLAGAVVYLASEASAYVSGGFIAVDGGYLVR